LSRPQKTKPPFDNFLKDHLKTLSLRASQSDAWQSQREKSKEKEDNSKPPTLQIQLTLRKILQQK